MSKQFNTLYELARYLQNEFHTSEWDMGCFIRTVDKIIQPLITTHVATFNNMDIVVSESATDKTVLNITFAEKRESIDVRINGTTIQIIPKTMELFA